MGVTLERVQNKFACIIGELCSEPVVLSQFAIWLDLRLAEYKAKGAISLECSGEHPDPSWLQGHIRVPPPPRIKPRVTAPVRSNRKNHTPSKIVSHTQVSASVRSPADVIVVKEEPTDYVEELGIFPVSLHKHDNWRKRTAPETAISDREFLESDDSLILQQGTSSTPKVRRVEGIPAVSLEPVSQETESLISIIAGESQLENSNSGDLTESVKMEYSNQERQHDQSGDNSTISLLGMPIASTSSADSDTLVQFPETEGPDTSNTGEAHQAVNDSSLWTDVNNQDLSVAEIDSSLTDHTFGLSSPRPRKTYRNWTETDMEEALSVVKAGQLSNTAASKKFNIPWSTLRNRLLAAKRKPKSWKYRLWSASDMEKAIEEVRSGILTLTQAGVKFGIPRSTLERRVVKFELDHVDDSCKPEYT